MPLLVEILATVPSSGQLFIEVKCGDEIIDPLIAELTQHRALQSQVVLIGFNAPLLAKIKTELPQVAALLCVSADVEKVTTWDQAQIKHLSRRAKHLHFDGVDLDARAKISRDAIDRLREHSLRCYFWTVDDPQYARSLARSGVDGITTNRPGWLRGQLERYSPTDAGESS